LRWVLASYLLVDGRNRLRWQSVGHASGTELPRRAGDRHQMGREPRIGAEPEQLVRGDGKPDTRDAQPVPAGPGGQDQVAKGIAQHRAGGGRDLGVVVVEQAAGAWCSSSPAAAISAVCCV